MAKFKYIIVEVDGHHASGDGATITELELYDRKGNKIPYNIGNFYDPGTTTYWSNLTAWGYNNMYDGELSYSSNSEGNPSTTLVLYKAAANAVMRFVITVAEDRAIDKIKIWAGSPEKRIPNVIRFYGCDQYTAANYNYIRSNEGLTELSSIKFNGTETSVRLYELSLETTSFLIQDGNVVFSYIDDAWAELGSAPATEEMFTNNSMSKIDFSSKELFKQFTKEAKILSYNSSEKKVSYKATNVDAYDKFYKSYKGPGIVETEIEELPSNRKSLMISADHEGCTFKYSLNGGTTWVVPRLDEILDIRNAQGVNLKIQITLPTEDAELRAIAYKWA